MKWRIPEATPSVPKDIYRIRTWLGLALHAEPKGDVLSVEKLEKKQHEEVRFEYRNTACGRFSNLNKISVALVGSSTCRKWVVRCQERFGWFFLGLGNRRRWHHKGRIEREVITRMDFQEHFRGFLVGGSVYLLHLLHFFDRITTSGKPLNGMYGLALSNGDTSEVCSPLQHNKYVDFLSFDGVKYTALYEANQSTSMPPFFRLISN